MIVCFDIGGTTIKGAYAEGGETVTVVPRVPTPTGDFEAFVAELKRVIDAAPSRVDGVALSIAAIVDPETRGMIVANIPCINGRDLETELSESFGLPVVVANDADCFALAEAAYGAGKGHDIVFGVILGSGVGGGLVVRGELINGNGGYAGEWGHGPISSQIAGVKQHSIPRFACGCGQVGCLDAVCSARGLERIDHHLHGVKRSSLEIIDAWVAGDPLAEETVDVHVDILSGPMAMLINMTGTTRVPVGGGLSNATRLIERLDQETRKKTLRKFRDPLVVPAVLTVEPGLIGSAVLAYNRLKLPVSA